MSGKCVSSRIVASMAETLCILWNQFPHFIQPVLYAMEFICVDNACLCRKFPPGIRVLLKASKRYAQSFLLRTIIHIWLRTSDGQAASSSGYANTFNELLPFKRLTPICRTIGTHKTNMIRVFKTVELVRFQCGVNASIYVTTNGAIFRSVGIFA